MGRRIVELAEPRTRDIVQLARAAFEIGAGRGRLVTGDIERALDQIVDEEHEMLSADWNRRTALQQNVLRAIAAGEGKLYSEAVRERYALRGTSFVASALETLIEHDVVIKKDEGEYEFDNPFMRRWVARNALPDVGIFPASWSDERESAPDVTPTPLHPPPS